MAGTPAPLLCSSTIARTRDPSTTLRVAAEPFGLVRVDIYTNGTDFYIGEISHTSNNATLKFIPPEAEQRISAIIFDEHDDRCA